MESENTFHYTYSASENQQILDIRRKYLPREETKLEELKRLDGLVQSSGTAESLCVGIGGCLIFGLGLCLAMELIGSIRWLGILLGLGGIGSMILAYPVYRTVAAKAKQKHVPRILQLVNELTGEN